MNKGLSILLIFNILVGTLPDNYAISVFKLINLYEHYLHHHESSQNLDFFKFLTDHYATEHHQEDQQGHDKLPFHQHELSNPAHQIPCLLPDPYIIVSSKHDIAVNLLNIRSQDCNSSLFSGDIWQPPKA